MGGKGEAEGMRNRQNGNEDELCDMATRGVNAHEPSSCSASVGDGQETDVSPENISQALSTVKFPFSSLPLELRLIVWKFASEEPRVIEVGAYRVRGYPKHWRPVTPQPGVFGACKESRDVAVKCFEKMEKKNNIYSR